MPFTVHLFGHVPSLASPAVGTVISPARLELAVTGVGVVCAALGYPLGLGALEYIGVLFAVAGFALALARTLGPS
jgi:hypothetical protein